MGDFFALRFGGVLLKGPSSDGTSGQVLQTDGSGNLSFATGGGGSTSLPTLTGGSVVFSDGSTLSEDNANFFWDDTNKKLGIGTPSPAVGLHTLGKDVRIETEILSLSGDFDISNATFSQSISSQDGTPRGIAWNNDGTKLYEVGSNGDLIYESTLSTAFDISTATFSQSINAQDSIPQGIAWNNNGTKLYEVGFNSNLIYESTLSTAFDISTATFSQSIATQDSSPQGIAWNNDGTKLYEVGFTSDLIYESTLSTAFDISTATFAQSINAQDITSTGIAWNNDGTKLYEVGIGSDLIYESTLSTAFDISTATFSQSISSQDGGPQGIAWNNDGTKLYEVGSSGLIYEYDIATSTTAVEGGTLSVDENCGIGTTNPASKLHVVGETDTDIQSIIQGASSQSANLTEWQDSAGGILSGYDENGYAFTRLNAAPSDASIEAGEAKYWFDDTDGAASFNIKAKQANGTVVTGSISLT